MQPHGDEGLFSPPITISWTDLDKGYSDLPPDVVDFLKAHNIHDLDAQEPGSKVDKEAVVGGAKVDMAVRFLRPKAKGGRWRRLSLRKALVDELRLEVDCQIQFEVRGTRLFMRLVDEPSGMSEDCTTLSTGEGDPARAIYPDRFLSWMGAGSGSVKRPFDSTAGRPLGRILDTPLVVHLGKLAEEIVRGNSHPRLIILAGGAGNGKSDALEEFLARIASHGEDPDTVVRRLGDQFSVPERVVSFSAQSVFEGLSLPFKNLVIVQDATEGDESGGGAGELLARDLETAIKDDAETLVVCCINRGILEEARFCAEQTEEGRKVRELLDLCTEVLDPTAVTKACWPIEKDEGIYLWPLDLESLADSNGGGGAVVGQIIREVVGSEWSTAIPGGSAVASNKALMEDPDLVCGLVSLIRDHEILSGRRWAFRDLFGLLGNLFVGGSLRHDGERPEDAADRLRLPDAGGGADSLVKATFDCLRATIPQLLFPRWPSCSGDWVSEATKKLDMDNTSIARVVGRYVGEIEPMFRSPIEELISGEWSDRLDPALGMPEEWKVEVGERQFSEREIEDRFNVSLESALELLEPKLGEIERAAIKLLADAEGEVHLALQEKRDSESLRLGMALQGWMRKLACAITKRFLGFVSGWGHESAIARDFMGSIENNKLFEEELTTLKGILIHENSYRVPLNLGLGQPRSTSSSGPFLDVQMPRIKCGPAPSKHEGRPMGLYREFLVDVMGAQADSLRLPYTIELFRRLRLSRDGLLDGCLDPMLRSCLDQLRVRLDGQAARCWRSAIPIEIILPDDLGTFSGYPDELEFNKRERRG